MSEPLSPEDLSQKADENIAKAADEYSSNSTRAGAFATIALAYEVRALRLAITGGDGHGQSRGLGDLFELLSRQVGS